MATEKQDNGKPSAQAESGAKGAPKPADDGGAQAAKAGATKAGATKADGAEGGTAAQDQPKAAAADTPKSSAEPKRGTKPTNAKARGRKTADADKDVPKPKRVADAGKGQAGRSRYLLQVDDASGEVVEVLKVDARSGEQRPLTPADIAESLARAFVARQHAGGLLQRQMNANASGEVEAPAAQPDSPPADFAANDDDGGDELARAYYQGALDFLIRINAGG